MLIICIPFSRPISIITADHGPHQPQYVQLFQEFIPTANPFNSNNDSGEAHLSSIIPIL